MYCCCCTASGTLVLEEYEHAKARGAKIYAEYVGGYFTCDAHHMTEPQPEGKGVRLCIERALGQAGGCGAGSCGGTVISLLLLLLLLLPAFRGCGFA